MPRQDRTSGPFLLSIILVLFRGGVAVVVDRGVTVDSGFSHLRSHFVACQ